MRVLILCEMSGAVRDAFAARGHEALSVDVLPSLSQNGEHHQGDAESFLATTEPWDMVISFPPCTHLANIGACYWPQKRADGRQQAAVDFVLMIRDHAEMWGAPYAVENPVGYLSTAWRKPDQIIQPWWFGDPWKKQTCLWLSGLPKLEPTDTVEPRGHWVNGGTLTGKDPKMEGSYAPSEKKTNGSRAVARAVTFQGIADAMASQWG